MITKRLFFLLTLACLLLAARCSDSSQMAVIGGIPDQNLVVLEERFDGLAEYLSDSEIAGGDFSARYQPSIDYAAIVTAFANADLLLGWFGGLTGVQARIQVPEAVAIAQRPGDAQFHSVFIVRTELDAETLADLAGRSFSFGSEISTSGRLMPEFFMRQEGINPAQHFGEVFFSGSHEKTWQLVESGTYDAGVLNKNVWDNAVQQDRVDTTRVRLLSETPSYFDYHWLAHPRIDEIYGSGTIAQITTALQQMDEAANSGNTAAADILGRFNTEEFIPTQNSNYDEIEDIATQLGLLSE